MNRVPPSISVIMINFSNSHILDESINSIINQEYKNIEFIIVDSGSEDNSHEIISSFENFPNIKMYFHSKNQPPLSIVEAREVGIGLANGCILCFADSDCIYPSSWIANIIRDFNTYNVAAVFGPRYPDQGKGLGTCVRRLEGHRSRKFNQKTPTIIDANSMPILYFSGSNLAIKRYILENIPFSDFNFMGTSFEDVAFEIRILSKGFSLYYDPELIIEHHHQLDLKGLLAKSKKSGIGFALLFQQFPKILLHKWSPIQDIFIFVLATSFIFNNATIFTKLLAFLFLLAVNTVWKIWSPQILKENILNALLCIPIKFLRDVTFNIFFFHTLLKNKIKSTRLCL